MKKIAFITAVVMTFMMCSCNSSDDEIIPEEFHETTSVNVMPNVTEAISAVTEQPIIVDGYEHYLELKFSLPDNYKKEPYYDIARYICDTEHYYTVFSVRSRSRMFDDDIVTGIESHEEYYFFRISEWGETPEKREFLIDGAEAYQETYIIPIEKGYNIMSVVNITTETTFYIFSFYCLEAKNMAEFENFNKMFDNMEITEQKREPQEFDDDIDSIIGLFDDEGVKDSLPLIDFELPENLYLVAEDYSHDAHIFCYDTRGDMEFYDLRYEYPLIVKIYDNETSPLFSDCSEEFFRSLTDTDIQGLNSSYRYIYNDSDDCKNYDIFNINRFDIDGYPAVYFENENGFKNCIIIYTESAVCVLRIFDVDQIRKNVSISIRYSDYVYSNLKISDTEKSEIFIDDISEFILDTDFPEYRYVDYNDGKISIASPGLTMSVDKNDSGLLRFGGYNGACFNKYDGVPLELLDENYFRNIEFSTYYWARPNNVEIFKRGKFKGYNCLIVKFSENKMTDNQKQIRIYIDAEEYGMYLLSVRMLEDISEERNTMIAKYMFSSIKFN